MVPAPRLDDVHPHAWIRPIILYASRRRIAVKRVSSHMKRQSVAVVGHNSTMLVHLPDGAVSDEGSNADTIEMGSTVLRSCIEAVLRCTHRFKKNMVEFIETVHYPVSAGDYTLLRLEVEGQAGASSRLVIKGIERFDPVCKSPKVLGGWPARAVEVPKSSRYANMSVVYWNANACAQRERRMSDWGAQAPLTMLYIAALAKTDPRDVARLNRWLSQRTSHARVNNECIVVTSAASLSNLGIRLRIDRSWEDFADDTSILAFVTGFFF